MAIQDYMITIPDNEFAEGTKLRIISTFDKVRTKMRKLKDRIDKVLTLLKQPRLEFYLKENWEEPYKCRVTFGQVPELQPFGIKIDWDHWMNELHYDVPNAEFTITKMEMKP